MKETKSSRALDALAAEARSRGITYGKLISATTAAERKQIVEEYDAQQRKEKKG